MQDVHPSGSQAADNLLSMKAPGIEVAFRGDHQDNQKGQDKPRAQKKAEVTSRRCIKAWVSGKRWKVSMKMMGTRPDSR